MFGQQPETEREPSGNRPKKGSSSRFAEWVQTTQGIVSIIATVVTLIGGAGSAAFALYHHGQQPSPSPTPSPIITATTINPSPASPSPPPSPSPAPSPLDYFDQLAGSAQLTQALLTPGVLGTAAEVTRRGTNLSGLTAICGDLIPSGVQLTADDAIYDAQTKQSLEETVLEWDGPRDAAALITDDHVALDQTGGCSFSTDGKTIHWTGDYTGPVSSNCSNGQYIATQVSSEYPYVSGFEASVQCGRYTVTITILDGNGSSATQETANAYMDNAMARLQEAIGFGQS